jgi:hypothetical protein
MTISRAASAIASSCGSAAMKLSSVTNTSRASMCSAGNPRSEKKAATSCDESCSPNAAIASKLRGVACPSTDRASARLASSSNVALISPAISDASGDVPSSFSHC